MSWTLRPRRSAVGLAIVLAVLATGSSDCGRTDTGRLTIEIVSPSTEPSMVTSDPNVPVGGNVDGWSILDEAPVIYWRNSATGASGQTDQLSGTWGINGGVDLQPGANHIIVRASNGVQEDASDSIVVTYQP